MFQGENQPYCEVSQSTDIPPNNEGDEAACTSSDCQSNQSESSTDSRGRLSLLETELQARTRDLDRLKFKIDKMKSHQMSSPVTSRRETKPINIKIEVERLRKDKKVMAELLKQSQQELTRKDSINRKLKMENDKISRNMMALQGKLAENGRTQNLLEELNRVRNELSLLTNKTDRLTPAYQGQTTGKDDKGRYIEELVVEKEQLKQCLSAIYFKITPYAVSLPSRSATPPVWTEDVKNTFDQFWEEKVKLQRELEELREQVKSREASVEQNRTSPECYETSVSDCSSDSKSDYLSDATIVKVSRPTGHHDLESEVCRWKEMYQNVYDKYRTAQHTISYHEKKFKKIYSAMDELTKRVYGEENFSENVSGYNMTKVIQKLSEEYAQLKESVKKIKHEEKYQTDLQNSIIEAEKILEEKGRNARTLRNAIGTLQLTSNMETKVASLAETMLLIYNNQLNWLKQLEHNNTLPNSEGEETHSNSPNQCELDLPMQDDDKVDNRLSCGDAMSCSSESNESSTGEVNEVIHKTITSDLNVKCSSDDLPQNDEKMEPNEENPTSGNGTEFVQASETCEGQESQDEVKIENAEVISGEDEIKKENENKNVENEEEKEIENIEKESANNENEDDNLDNVESTEQVTSSEVQTETNVDNEVQSDTENESSQKEQESEANAEEKETKDSDAPEEVKDNKEDETEKNNAEENEGEDEKKENDSEETKNDEKDGKDKDEDDDEQNNSNADKQETAEDEKDDTEETSKDDDNKEEEPKKEDVDKEDDVKQEKEMKDQSKSLPIEQNENEDTTVTDENCENDENSEIIDMTEDKENTENDTEKQTDDTECNETDSKIELEQNLEEDEDKLTKETLIEPKLYEETQSRTEGQNSEKENNEGNIVEKLEETKETTAPSEEEKTADDTSTQDSQMEIINQEENASQDDDPGSEDNDGKEHCVQNHLVQSVVAEVHNSAETQEYITDNINSENEPEHEDDRISTIPEADEETEESEEIKDSTKDNEAISEANDQSEDITDIAEGSELNVSGNDLSTNGPAKAENPEEKVTVNVESSQGEDGDHETIQHITQKESDNQIIITETEQANSEESPCSSISHSLSTSENKDNIKIIINSASSEEHETANEETAQSSTNDGQENTEIKNSLEKGEDESQVNDEHAEKDETELAPVIEPEITKVIIEPRKSVFFSNISVLEKDAADDCTTCKESTKQCNDDSLSKRIEELETEMSEMLEVKRHHMKVACDLAEKLEEMKKRESDLQDQLSNAETKTSQEVEGLWKEWSGREQSYQDEIAAWKENVEQQNSVLQRLKADLDQAQQIAQLKEDEIAELRSIEKEKQPDSLLERETQTSDQEEDPNSKELQETVDRLRITSEHYQQQLMENRTVVREVKSIIEGSVAQLVTLKAMGTKHMKREYVYRNNLAQRELDLKHLQSELDKQSIDARAKTNIIEKQRTEIRSLREEMRKCQKDISAKVEFIDELQSRMQNLISSESKPNNSNPEDLEIYAIGRRCIDEQHAIQLEKHKEELERMRQELHLLELKCSDIDSAAESSDQQNLSHPGSAGSVGSVSEELPPDGNLCLCKRKDVNKILKLSEESYLNLLASLVVCLGIQDMKYNKSLQRLSWSQCKEISAERKANQKRIMKVIQSLKKEERTVSPRLQPPERSRSTGETEKRRGLVKCISPQNGRSMYISDIIRQAEESLDKDKLIKSCGRKPTTWRPHTSLNDRRIPLELKNGEILALLGNAEPKSVPKPALSSK